MYLSYASGEKYFDHLVLFLFIILLLIIYKIYKHVDVGRIFD
jgi:hypothetical protein